MASLNPDDWALLKRIVTHYIMEQQGVRDNFPDGDIVRKAIQDNIDRAIALAQKIKGEANGA